MREGRERNKVSDEEFTMLYERALRRMRERENERKNESVKERERQRD